MMYSVGEMIHIAKARIDGGNRSNVSTKRTK